MGEREDKVKADIVAKFGSVPKMAREIGVPQNTIYHALERGMDNTTQKTRSAILEALYGSYEYTIVNLWNEEEQQLVELFRALSDRSKKALIAGLREYGNK